MLPINLSIFSSILLSILYNPVIGRIDRVHPDQKQKDLLHQTFKSLLNIDEDSDSQPKTIVTKSTRAASKYMRRLFDRYRKHDFANLPIDLNQKTIVRAIMPKFGHIQNREALIFDLESISSTESLLKAELHYYLGPKASADPSVSKRLRCHVISLSQSKVIDMQVPLIMLESDDNRSKSKNWAVFDAMQFVNTTVTESDISSDNISEIKPRLLAVVFAKSTRSGSDRYLSIRKTLRFHAPFLSLSSRDAAALSIDTVQDEIDDDDESSDQDDQDQKTRRKREVDSKYYEYYHPYETPYTTSPNDVGHNWRSVSTPKDEADVGTTDYVQRGPSVLRRNGQAAKARRNKKRGRGSTLARRYPDQYLEDGNDAWLPFEQDRKKKYGKVLKAKEDDRNPTAVVLLDGKQSDTGAITCQRNDLVVDFKDIGWGDYIIAPSSFEAHYCAGSCPFPIPPAVNATNHAIVLDIIQKIGLHAAIPKPCCAPEKMDSLSLLYYDANGNVVLTTYPRMSVVSCACL